MRKLGGSSVFPRELFDLLSATKPSGLSPLELTFAEFLPQLGWIYMVNFDLEGFFSLFPRRMRINKLSILYIMVFAIRLIRVFLGT
ncbi:hypothetical protein KFK09_016732 [Dendrobium nobile]|uniref:Uncharacterized protein n=1 Tax=Dendrobium nobile TaxID=94219 RepID=A0A8T3B075_DENNO|nr:hypothetical protein KFK09_016732 [Dendrobium nobile]